MPRPLVALAIVAITSVAFMFLFAGWEQGFSQGARQATDQILAERDQTEEVIRLQAQLDEQQRAEDRISNTLLAAFTAGAAVLVIVNFASYFIAQQRLQEERRGLREDLIRDAEDRDRTMDQALRAHIDQRIALVENRQVSADARMDQLAEMAGTGSRAGRLADANLNHTLGNEMETMGDHIMAAWHYSDAAAILASDGRKSTSLVLLIKIALSLNNADPTNFGPDEMLDMILKNLQTVDTSPPPNANISARVERARSLVERFRTQRDARDTQQSSTKDDIPQ